MITAPPPKQYPLPEEGMHELRLTMIKDKPNVLTSYGPRDKISFGFDVQGTDNGEGKPCRVWKEFYKSMGRSRKPSQLALFAQKMLGRNLTEDEFRAFDEVSLVNKTIRGEIVHNVTERGTFANVEEFYKNRVGANGKTEPEEAQEDDEEVPL